MNGNFLPIGVEVYDPLSISERREIQDGKVH